MREARAWPTRKTKICESVSSLAGKTRQTCATLLAFYESVSSLVDVKWEDVEGHTGLVDFLCIHAPTDGREVHVQSWY